MMRIAWVLALLACSSFLEVRASDRQIADRIWQNECGGKIEGLTSWNEGEEFASLGIGHFIWYPQAVKKRYAESFPSLIAYLRGRCVTLPTWLIQAQGCPWATREEFLEQSQSSRMEELRELLAATRDYQAEFIAWRLEHALPRLTNPLSEEERLRITSRLHSLMSSEAGQYACIDYLNFKGEGTALSERYCSEGWGLLQVLQKMREDEEPVMAFKQAAEEVLRRRVDNSPPEKNESRWLPGWLNRIETYLE